MTKTTHMTPYMCLATKLPPAWQFQAKAMLPRSVSLPWLDNFLRFPWWILRSSLCAEENWLEKLTSQNLHSDSGFVMTNRLTNSEIKRSLALKPILLFPVPYARTTTLRGHWTNWLFHSLSLPWVKQKVGGAFFFEVKPASVEGSDTENTYLNNNYIWHV